MRLFSYVIATDSGFAPNPYHGVCTLACCKPSIRRTARLGDWIAGLTGKRDGHRLVFAMMVNEVLSIEAYWRDQRFINKRPNFTTAIGMCGDNIYEPIGNGEFRQHPSRHAKRDPHYPPHTREHYTDVEDLVQKSRDLSGKRVLVANDFVYFGKRGAGVLPKDLQKAMAVGRGYKNRFTPEEVERWRIYIATLPRGLHDTGASDSCTSPHCSSNGCKRVGGSCRGRFPSGSRSQNGPDFCSPARS